MQRALGHGADRRYYAATCAVRPRACICMFSVLESEPSLRIRRGYYIVNNRGYFVCNFIIARDSYTETGGWRGARVYTRARPRATRIHTVPADWKSGIEQCRCVRAQCVADGQWRATAGQASLGPARPRAVLINTIIITVAVEREMGGSKRRRTGGARPEAWADTSLSSRFRALVDRGRYRVDRRSIYGDFADRRGERARLAAYLACQARTDTPLRFP